MNVNDRNLWQGLTTSQIKDLEAAITEPHRAAVDPATAYRDISTAFAIRSAALLVANDLRGALHYAEISVAASFIAQRRDEGMQRALERLDSIRATEALDPRGVLTYVPGKKRSIRVKPSTTAAPSVTRGLRIDAKCVADDGPLDARLPSLHDPLPGGISKSA